MSAVKYRRRSIMLWACLSSKDDRKLIRVHSITDSLKYLQFINILVGKLIFIFFETCLLGVKCTVYLLLIY